VHERLHLLRPGSGDGRIAGGELRDDQGEHQADEVEYRFRQAEHHTQHCEVPVFRLHGRVERRDQDEDANEHDQGGGDADAEEHRIRLDIGEGGRGVPGHGKAGAGQQVDQHLQDAEATRDALGLSATEPMSAV
jgi:hypothetical protein